MKPLFDSVVALPLDDPPLALAAAAVLYFLALDVRLNICCFCLELELMVMLKDTASCGTSVSVNFKNLILLLQRISCVKAIHTAIRQPRSMFLSSVFSVLDS